MFVVTGLTGQVGAAVADTLLAAGLPVRGVVRDMGRAGAWAERGCALVSADMSEVVGLQAAFSDAEAVFVVLPPNFDPSPGFPEARALIANLQQALAAARPQRVVCLSTVGAQASAPNLLTALSLLEQQLGQLDLPISFLRAAWFMENSRWDLDAARDSGLLHSFLQPLQRAIPMVATADVGRVAAELMQESWSGQRVIELEGPRPVSPMDLAAAWSALLGHPVTAQAVPRTEWESLFQAQGHEHPAPRMQMLDGFNQGWLSFEHTPRQGRVELDEVLRTLLHERH